MVVDFVVREDCGNYVLSYIYNREYFLYEGHIEDKATGVTLGVQGNSRELLRTDAALADTIFQNRLLNIIQ